MRSKILVSILLLSCLAVSGVSTAQSKKAKRIPRLPQTTPQGLEGGFWRTDISFDSELHLRNVLSKQALDVTPEIFFADGTEYDLPPIHLEPSGVFSVDITAALHDPDVPKSIQPHISKYGMVGISYQWSWPAVMACVQNTDHTVSLSAGSSPLASKEAVHKSPEDTQPQVIRSSWWRPTKDSDELIAVGNTSLKTKQVQIHVSDASGSVIASKQFPLPSHQTTLVRLNDLLPGNIDPGTAGDVTVLYSGPPHSVATAASIEDARTGFSVTPSMVETAPADSESPLHPVTLHAPGLMLGKMDSTMGFPPGVVFMPYAVLHNISIRPVSAALSFTSEDSSGNSVTRSLDTIPLARGQTTALDMSRYFTSATPLPDGFGNLSVTFTGQYGDVLFDTGSADPSENYIFPVIPATEAPTTSKAFAFWQLDGATSTMISVWNYSATKAQDATLTLNYSGGQYRIPLHLRPRQTYNLDLMDLMRYGKPDADGKLLPEDVSSGSATLVGPGGELDKMTIVTSASTYNAHNATCFPMCIDCGGLTSLYLDPDTIIIITQGWGQAYGYYTSSYGGPYTFTGGNWSSSNPAVAPIYSSGSIYGQAPGWATMLAQMSAPPGGMTCYQSAEGVCADENFEGAGLAGVYNPSVNITIAFNGQKTVGDNLSFEYATPIECTEYLGPVSCPSYWAWNIEGKGAVTDNAASWAVTQLVSWAYKGYYKTPSGTLMPISRTSAQHDDPLNPTVLQQTAGSYSIFWIDGPGFLKNYSTGGNSYAVDSVTIVQNFTTTFCSTLVPLDCSSKDWYSKVVVDPGANLDTGLSASGYGWQSLTF